MHAPHNARVAPTEVPLKTQSPQEWNKFRDKVADYVNLLLQVSKSFFNLQPLNASCTAVDLLLQVRRHLALTFSH